MGDLTDKEKVVHRLEGNEIKEFKIVASNQVTVPIEATSEKEAERIFREKLDDNYDFPYQEAEDYYGWEIEEVNEY